MRRRLRFGIVKIQLYIYNENKEEAGKGDNFVKVFQTMCIFPIKHNDSSSIFLFLSCLSSLKKIVFGMALNI